MKLVVALGNPGSEYVCTRHNVGQMLLDRYLGSSFGWKSKFKGEFLQSNIQGERVIFLKPLTYMNLSGQSVRPCMDFFKIKIDDLLIIHDELDLPLGRLMFKAGGGFAGHNGLKSIGQQVGDANFKRLRIGIGRPRFGAVSDYVLGKFSAEEEILLNEVLVKGVEALECYLRQGFAVACSNYNKKK